MHQYNVRVVQTVHPVVLAHQENRCQLGLVHTSPLGAFGRVGLGSFFFVTVQVEASSITSRVVRACDTELELLETRKM